MAIVGVQSLNIPNCEEERGPTLPANYIEWPQAVTQFSQSLQPLSGWSSDTKPAI
jgi:hypothetical protein